MLECGPGVTTVVIANALRENFVETGLQGKITCMENHKVWYEMANEILPNEFKEITSFVLSDIEEKPSQCSEESVIKTCQKRIMILF